MKKMGLGRLGWWGVRGGIEREGDRMEKIVEEMMSRRKSEGSRGVMELEEEASMEEKKGEGYF